MIFLVLPNVHQPIYVQNKKSNLPEDARPLRYFVHYHRQQTCGGNHNHVLDVAEINDTVHNIAPCLLDNISSVFVDVHYRLKNKKIILYREKKFRI